MKLEIGKTYRTRDGKRMVKIVRWYPIDATLSWAEDENGSHWLPSGRRSLWEFCDDDLVEEVPDTVPVADECGRCGSVPGKRDLTCPECSPDTVTVITPAPETVYRQKDAPTIPHAELIRAVLDGKRVQKVGQWIVYDGQAALKEIMATQPHESWQIKSQTVVKWGLVSAHVGEDPVFVMLEGYSDREQAAAGAENHQKAVLLRLELDPDTLDVISARTEAP